jgi:hypothetical protein
MKQLEERFSPPLKKPVARKSSTDIIGLSFTGIFAKI